MSKCTHSFAFDRGWINVRTKGHADNGSGHVGAYVDDVDFDVSDKSSKEFITIKLYREDLIELRDWLTKTLTEVEPSSQPEPAP